jgi:hypothetical protein
MAYLQILFQHLHGGNDENHEEYQNRLFPGRDSKREPLEYEATKQRCLITTH